MPDRRNQLKSCLPVPLALVTLLCFASACRPLDQGPSPAELIEQAKAAAKQRKYIDCYDLVKTIRTDHSEASAADRKEAFKVAAHCYHRLYMSYRLAYLQALADEVSPHEKTMRWLQPERDFMYEWLASYFEGEESPRQWAEILLIGFPHKFYKEFKEYQASRPELAHWELTARWDNGIIEEVAAARVETGQAQVPQRDGSEG